MSFVAVVCTDPNLKSLFIDDFFLNAKFHLVNPQKPVADVCKALVALDYAGAVILEPSWQEQALDCSQRPSVVASRVGVTDTLVVTPAGLVSDFVLGSAFSNLLADNQWDVRGAHVVLTGNDPITKVLAGELASLGVASLSIIAEQRIFAEKMLPRVALTQARAFAFEEAATVGVLERADLLVRTELESHFPEDLLGPHLSVIDLSPSPLSSLRQNALALGAKTLGLRDLQAYQLADSLGLIVGQKLDASLFLTPLLALD